MFLHLTADIQSKSELENGNQQIHSLQSIGLHFFVEGHTGLSVWKRQLKNQNRCLEHNKGVGAALRLWAHTGVEFRLVVGLLGPEQFGETMWKEDHL